MMSLSLAVFTLLLRLPQHHLDKGEPDRDARMLVNATGIAAAAERVPVPDKYMMAAYLIEQGEADSAWRYDVQIGLCRADECDPFRCTIDGVPAICHAARGPWQRHRDNTMSDADWGAFISLEQVDVNYASLSTAKLAAYYYTKCGGSVGVYNGFAYGRCLPFGGAEQRAKEAQKFAAKLRRLVRG